MTKPARLHDAGGTITEAAGFGVMEAYGPTVPSDAAAGYATGCVFHHTDGGAGTALYINEGSVTSADFNAVAGA